MPIKIHINGASGRMGKLTVATIKSHAELSLAGITDRGDDLLRTIEQNQADVVVDLTNANAVWENANIILDSGARPVIGTSGLLPKQIAALTERCQNLNRGGIIAPNFSIGAILMMKYAQDAAQYFSHVEIIESHHNKKLDSPSGTALKTAEMIASTQHSLNPTSSSEKQTISGARGATHCNIPIHAIRLPGLSAHQQVKFGGHDEALTIQHDTLSREAYMPGICLACEKVMTLNTLVYGLENII